MSDSFGARHTLTVSGREYEIFRLDALQDRFDVARLPYSLKVLLENALRLEDGDSVTAHDVETIATWDAGAEPSEEIPFQPARVLMQDFTGVPAIVDLAAMRDAIDKLGSDASRINPLVPVDLVIDHSVQVDAFGNPRAFDINADRDYERNGERYAFLRWGQQAFDNFRVVPPATGICHQVNLEYLSQVVFTPESNGSGPTPAYPDTLVGTDSHTTMVNGLGVLGWGVGGIEAEAAMLGQPISMLLPQVVGFRLDGELPEGSTATDLVLTVTEMLRERGVVSKFVEFFGPGLGTLGLADRATIGNMSPEFGSTCAIFPVDRETLRYLEFTGRPTEMIELVDAYAREQGMFWDADSEEPTFSETLELDLDDVEPSIAGPKRPQDRIALADARLAFLESLREHDPDAAEELGNDYDEAVKESFPASDPPAEDHNDERGRPRHFDRDAATAIAEARADDVVPVTLEDGTEIELDHGHVVIAAITSCTNTSNPSVMVGAGLLARKAVERGLERKPWVKTSLAPGSTVVTDYLEQAGLDEYLDRLGFHLVGYGCTTCIGNSGPLPEAISKAVNDHELVVCAVLSGNRNFEGRIQHDVRNNYLASPPLCVAYALAGRMDVDLTSRPARRGRRRQPGVPLRHLAEQRGDQIDDRRGGAAGHVRAQLRGRVHRRRSLAGARDPGRRSLHVARVDLRARAPVLRGHGPGAGPDRADLGRAGAGGARRQRHDRPHLARGRHPQGQPRGPLADRERRRAARLQLLRLTARQPRGDDPRHLRERAAPQQAGRARGRLHAPFPGRRGDDDLRGGDGLRRGGRPAGGAGGQGVRLGLVARLGGQGNRAAGRARGDRGELRAHPPLEPDRNGRVAAPVPGGGDDRLARADRRGGLRRSVTSRMARRRR